MGDLGVVSYLADADGNVVIGPSSSLPTALLSKPSTPVKPKHPASATSTPPLSPTSPSFTPEEKAKKKEKKKVTRRKDSVILKLPAGEVESVEAMPPTTPVVTPGPETTAMDTALPETEEAVPEASTEELTPVEV